MTDCEYTCEFHKTKKGTADWHHPISEHPEVGVYLCEAHHSLLLGRKTRYPGEMIINKSNIEMRNEIIELVKVVVIKSGFHESDIDKN